MNHPLTITLRDAEQALEKIRAVKAELAQDYSPHIYFTDVYITSTEQLLNAAYASTDKSHLQHDRFKQIDADFMHNLIYQFSKRYLDAYLAHKQAKANTPNIWSQAFTRSTEITDAGTAVLIGALVHMSFDLPLILNTTLANEEPLFNISSPKAVHTYLEIDSILTESVPIMIARMETLQEQMGVHTPPRKPWFSNALSDSQLGKRLSAGLTYWLIRLTRQEARWLDIKLRKNKVSKNDIERIVRNRLNLIRGDGSYLWYMIFLTYGLVARNFNRTKLSG